MTATVLLHVPGQGQSAPVRPASSRLGWSVHHSRHFDGSFSTTLWSVTHSPSGAALLTKATTRVVAERYARAMRHAFPDITMERLLRLSGRWRKWAEGVNHHGGLVEKFHAPPKTAPSFAKALP